MTQMLDQNETLNLLNDLEPVVEKELNRHISIAKEWFPHDYIPWDEARNFAHLGGQDWTPQEQRFSEAARTSLIINLLTEDNLPSYHHEIATIFGREGAWGEWVGRWTAEVANFGAAALDALRVDDPVALEQARMFHMQEGFQAIHPGMLAGLSYVSFQELATRVSHRNTGVATGDPIGESLLQRIALDENLHMIFYRNLLDAALELQPDATMVAILSSVRDFAMPGHGIEGFQRKAVEIAVAGIYDLKQHRDEVIMPVLRKWKIFERNDFGSVGNAARDELAQLLADMDVSVNRFEERRESLRARLAVRG